MKWDERAARRSAIAIGVARSGIGVVMLVRPDVVPRLLGGTRATAVEASWVTRMVGWREIAVGAGAAVSVQRHHPATAWLSGQIMLDVGDAVAFCAATRRDLLPMRKAIPSALQALSWAGVLAAALPVLRASERAERAALSAGRRRAPMTSGPGRQHLIADVVTACRLFVMKRGWACSTRRSAWV
jgi:hypothetical protein